MLVEPGWTRYLSEAEGAGRRIAPARVAVGEGAIMRDLFGLWRDTKHNRGFTVGPCDPPSARCVKLTWEGDPPGYRRINWSIHDASIFRSLVAEGSYVREASDDEPGR
jgi:hypothetical protein